MRKWKPVFGVCIGLLGTTTPVTAQVVFGPQIAWGSESDLGIGLRTFVAVPRLAEGARATAAVDYFFGDEAPDAEQTWIDANLGFTWGRELARGMTAWLGTGLNLAFVSATFEDDPELDTSETLPGLNLMAGWTGASANFTPFAELRMVVGEAHQVVVSAGLTFGG